MATINCNLNCLYRTLDINALVSRILVAKSPFCFKKYFNLRAI